MDAAPFRRIMHPTTKQKMLHEWHLTRLKGSVANMVPGTSAQLQGFSGVHVLMGQGCLGSKRGTKTVFGRWSEYCGKRN